MRMWRRWEWRRCHGRWFVTSWIFVRQRWRVSRDSRCDRCSWCHLLYIFWWIYVMKRDDIKWNRVVLTLGWWFLELSAYGTPWAEIFQSFQSVRTYKFFNNARYDVKNTNDVRYMTLLIIIKRVQNLKIFLAIYCLTRRWDLTLIPSYIDEDGT